MLKVYLDKNVYSKISKNKNILDSLTLSSEKDILFLYSEAHIYDLHRDKTDKKTADLALLEQICKDNFFQYNIESDRIEYTFYIPNEAFDEFLPNTTLFETWATNIFELGEGNGEIQNLLKGLLVNQEVDLGFDRHPENQTAENRQLLERVGITKSKYSMLEWMQVVGQMLDALSNDNTIIKDVRRLIKLNLQVEKFKVNINEVDFDKNLSKTVIGKSFLDFLEEHLETIRSKDMPISFYTRFITAFNLINFFGFDNEKNKKVKFMNTYHDSLHAYFGGACDVVVSDDEGFRQKAKFLYNLYGFDAEVYSFEEFIGRLSFSSRIRINSLGKFLNLLRYDIAYGLIIDNIFSIGKGQTGQIIKTNYRYFAHFNRISEILLHEDTSKYIILYQDSRCISPFIYYKDFHSVTDQMVNAFGEDDNCKSNFEASEMQDVKNNEWQGRTWTFENISYHLIRSIESGRLVLQIGPLSEDKMI